MSSKMTRRTFMGSAAAAGVTMMIPGRWAVAQNSGGASMTAPVQTSSGKVRGLVRNGVNQFWGLPYGSVDRRRQPVHAAGEASAMDRCTRLLSGWPCARRRTPKVPSRKSGHWTGESADGEDCLTINVFTPGLGTGPEAGHGVAARWRICGRFRQLAAVRRHEPRAQRRCRHLCFRESPLESLRASSTSRI